MHLVGMNGVGKSTLLKTILGKIPPLDGKVTRGDFLTPCYFEQEVKAGDITPIEEYVGYVSKYGTSTKYVVL